VIVFCAHGFSSSFAAVTLRELGWWTATDIVGGYQGWKAAGLPTRAVGVADEVAGGELPGMGGPAPTRDEVQAAIEDMTMKGGV
jgi:3-mercaptopyruvate sulfurtransferase SseA